ncbi:MAG: DUF4280 domain-containing protein [Polyangiales bacterium]
MSNLVVMGAMCKCSFGAAPASLVVLPTKMVNGVKMPIATIMDNIPIANIVPFAMCSSPSNPTVAAATAAALGVLTPMPCVPVVPAPWTPGKPMVMVGKVPALDKDSQAMCAWGGVIQVTYPGQVTVDAG